MKARILLILSFFFLSINAFTQPFRYFEFYTNDCGHNEWRDSVFIAAASDQDLIDTVLAELNKPIAERRFINGPIDYGNGGFNYNAHHSFNWHHIPDQWSLVEAAIEICDGCPHSDLDNNTAYFVDTVGFYCPWHGYPKREVQKPNSLENNLNTQVKIYPNPANEFAIIELNGNVEFIINVFSLHSEKSIITKFAGDSFTLDLSALKPGIYIIQIKTDNAIANKRLIVR